MNTNTAPWPTELDELIDKLRYKAGWSFHLDADLNRGQGSQGCTLSIFIQPLDAYHPEKTRPVVHYFPVPPAAFNPLSWRRWLLDQVLLVEQHEACEFFQIGEDHPYAPNHGPGNDPYTIRELRTDEDARTSFRGEVKP